MRDSFERRIAYAALSDVVKFFHIKASLGARCPSTANNSLREAASAGQQVVKRKGENIGEPLLKHPCLFPLGLAFHRDLSGIDTSIFYARNIQVKVIDVRRNLKIWMRFNWLEIDQRSQSSQGDC